MSKVGKTWFARFAGIIDAVLGCLALLGGIILSPRILGQTARMPGFNIFVFVVIILPLFVFGILSIVGSVFNIMTRRWRLALTGSISSLIVVAFLSLSGDCTPLIRQKGSGELRPGRLLRNARGAGRPAICTTRFTGRTCMSGSVW
jgi:hypothetical protein